MQKSFEGRPQGQTANFGLEENVYLAKKEAHQNANITKGAAINAFNGLHFHRDQ